MRERIERPQRKHVDVVEGVSAQREGRGYVR